MHQPGQYVGASANVECAYSDMSAMGLVCGAHLVVIELVDERDEAPCFVALVQRQLREQDAASFVRFDDSIRMDEFQICNEKSFLSASPSEQSRSAQGTPAAGRRSPACGSAANAKHTFLVKLAIKVPSQSDQWNLDENSESSVKPNANQFCH
eukprot:2933013-Pleurochrysis_carterae.AAC.2